MSGTHAVDVGGAVVVKRFRSWERGEHRREWAALTLLDRYSPGLAPVPIRAELTADPPTITMSRLPGVPLGEAPIGSGRLDALTGTIEQLHKAVPDGVLCGVPRWFSPSALAGRTARLLGEAAAPNDPLAQQAFGAGCAWFAGDDVAALVAAEVEPVFGHGDGNLANCLWDGERVRLVDFEDSGRSDRAFELAELVEHLSALDAGVEAAALLERFELSRAERARLRGLRRLSAFNWFLMLLPGAAAHDRNPPEALRRQAIRLLDLLG